MTTNKAGSATSVEGTHECCMCGDFGFSYELFQCKACQFRSQHRIITNGAKEEAEKIRRTRSEEISRLSS